VPGWNGLTEPEAVSYVAAVEAADGQELEFGVARAINDFVTGCKQDKIWDAIKASCILSGARTLAGALVPLKGVAPTNFNFVAADYDRKTGLVGDGSTKYLNTNRSCSLELQNNVHGAVYANTRDSSNGRYLGSSTGISFELLGNNSTGFRARVNDTTLSTLGTSTSSNVLIGVSRSSATAYSWRDGTQSGTQNNNSSGVASGNYFVFSGLNGYFPTDARIAFYSIGENLDLALLDTRISDFITAIGAAIP
jgi:hypothetical protein